LVSERTNEIEHLMLSKIYSGRKSPDLGKKVATVTVRDEQKR